MRVKLFFMAILFLSAGFVGAEEQLAHAIFVKVNGKTITQDNVVEAVRFIIKREYNNTMPEDEEVLDIIQKAALRDLVRMHLIHDEARRLSITMERAQQKRLLETSGLRPEEITPTIRRLLEAGDLFDDIMMMSGTPISSPSPREIKEFYNKNREEFRTNAFLIVRTIFVADDRSRPQAFFKDQAERMMAELEAVPLNMRTEAFAKLATDKSQDIFAEFGGLLTGNAPEHWIPKDFENAGPDGKPIFPPTMVEEIRRLNRAGEIRLAVSVDGMHLLYCEDVRGGRVLPWDEASRIIEYLLKQRRRNQGMRTWLNRVYDRSDVRWHDGTVYEKEMLMETLLPSERGAQL